jgi:hypothetical protein
MVLNSLPYIHLENYSQNSSLIFFLNKQNLPILSYKEHYFDLNLTSKDITVV